MRVDQQLGRQELDEWLISESNQCRVAIQQLLLVRLIADAVLSLRDISNHGAKTMMAKMIHGAATLQESYQILDKYLSEWSHHELPKILQEPRSILENHFKEWAKEWSVDYKPWENNLSPQEYGAYGFQKGIDHLLRHMKRDSRY